CTNVRFVPVPHPAGNVENRPAAPQLLKSLDHPLGHRLTGSCHRDSSTPTYEFDGCGESSEAQRARISHSRPQRLTQLCLKFPHVFLEFGSPAVRRSTPVGVERFVEVGPIEKIRNI